MNYELGRTRLRPFDHSGQAKLRLTFTIKLSLLHLMSLSHLKGTFVTRIYRTNFQPSALISTFQSLLEFQMCQMTVKRILQ